VQKMTTSMRWAAGQVMAVRRRPVTAASDPLAAATRPPRPPQVLAPRRRGLGHRRPRASRRGARGPRRGGSPSQPLSPEGRKREKKILRGAAGGGGGGAGAAGGGEGAAGRRAAAAAECGSGAPRAPAAGLPAPGRAAEHGSQGRRRKGGRAAARGRGPPAPPPPPPHPRSPPPLPPGRLPAHFPHAQGSKSVQDALSRLLLKHPKTRFRTASDDCERGLRMG